MRERGRASRQETIQTTLRELARAVREVSTSDDQAFTVLDPMVAERGIPVSATTQLPMAA